MKRPFALIGLTVFFTLAFLYNVPGRAAVLIFVFFTAAFAVSACVRSLRDGKVFPVAFASAALACLLLIAGNEFSYYPQLKLDGQTREVSAVLTSDSYAQYGNYYYDAKLVSVDGQKTGAKVRIVFSSDSGARAYDTVSGKFTFYALGSTSETVADKYKTEGRYLGMTPADDGYTFTPRSGGIASAGYALVSFRSTVKSLIMRMLPNDYGALCLALVLGDRSMLSSEAYAGINTAGVTHIICVSGLHLSIWTSALLFLFRRLRLKEKAAAAVTMPFVIFIMLAAGLTYSVARAGIMMLVYLASILLSRQKDSLNSLGIAVTLISAVNPFSPGALSFRLSVLSTLGIILYSEYGAPHIKAFFERHGRISFLQKPAGLLFVTACAAAFCLPVTVDVYGTVNFAVFPSNLLVIWAGEICMIASVLGAAVTAISAGIFNLPGFTAGLLARYILKVTHFISRLGFLTVRVPRNDALIMLTLIFLLCALSALIACPGKKVFPALPVTAAGLLIFCLVISVTFDRKNTEIRAIDTGNGTSVMVSENGVNLLFGCGGDSFNAVRNITDAADRAGGDITAVILPDGSGYSSSNLYALLSRAGTERLYITPETSTAGIDGDAEIFDASLPGAIGGISFIPFGDGRIYGYYVETDDARVAILFYPFLPDNAPAEISGSQVVVSRMGFPENTQFTDLSLAVIQADNARGCALADTLTGEGINAVATAGNGNILITSRGGDFRAEREQ